MAKQKPREKIAKLSDGRFMIDLQVPKAIAAKFYQACNIISEELGRPVSKAEALEIMLDEAIEKLEEEVKNQSGLIRPFRPPVR